MERTGSGTGFIAMLAVLFLVGLAALMLLGPMLASTPTTITIARPPEVVSAPGWGWGQTDIASGMYIGDHAAGHAGQALDAELIYSMLLEGKCAASAVFCGGSDIEKLYLCVDPVTGLIGGLFVTGEVIWNGYGARESYWRNQVESDLWKECGK